MYIITYVLYLYIEKHITITEMENGILIGGQALIQLGSSRGTIDTDYLVNISDARTFIHDEEDIDLINAGGRQSFAKFFLAIWNIEKGNTIATPQSLLELKAYSYIQHLKNGNGQKADDAEYDMRFLVRTFKLKGVKIVSNYLSKAEQKVIQDLIKAVRK